VAWGATLSTKNLSKLFSSSLNLQSAYRPSKKASKGLITRLVNNAGYQGLGLLQGLENLLTGLMSGRLGRKAKVDTSPVPLWRKSGRRLGEAMWLMLQQDTPEDLAIAAGEAYAVRDFWKRHFPMPIWLAGIRRDR
jgi:hypothetical protein